VKIIVTRQRGGSERLSERLRADGFDVEECPLIRIEPVEGPAIRADRYDWVVLTSPNAVDMLFRRLDGPLPRTAVIGPGTAEALRAHGVEPALVARTSTQEGLLDELPRPAGRVLFAGAEGARALLPQVLGADVVILYRTVEERPPSFPAGDLVVLASASAARSFAALGLDLPCVSIGPVTSDEARRAGLRILAEARTHDVEGLLEAVRLATSQLSSIQQQGRRGSPAGGRHQSPF
jgi:uroporphyrinogen III methyltransferase/synthase